VWAILHDSSLIYCPYWRPTTENTKRIRGHHDEEDTGGIALDFDQADRLYQLGTTLFAVGLCRLWNAIFVSLSIGLRRGEVMGLRWQDVDFQTRTLLVRKGLVMTENGYQLGSLKTPQSRRDIPLEPGVFEAFLVQKTLMQAEAELRREILLPTMPVFATTTGAFTSPDNLARALNNIVGWSNPNLKPAKPRDNGATPRVMKQSLDALSRRLKSVPIQHRENLEQVIRAGDPLPQMSPHDLRHTAGTLFSRRGMEISVVSQILGHASITITYRTHLVSHGSAKRLSIN
jgi:integrase